VAKAGVQTISVGQIAVGPISVANLVLNNIDFSMSAAQAVLQNMTVKLTLRITAEWHVHVGLPDGIPDIDIGRTDDLGSLSFSLAVGNIVIPGLNNLQFHMPSLIAQNLSAAAGPLSLQINNATAEQVHGTDLVVPTAGFTIAGLSLASLGGNGLGVPAANLGQASVGHLHGDPVRIQTFNLGALNIPAAQIPTISSSVPLSIPANLDPRSLGFDAGILRFAIHITPSVVSSIDRLEIKDANLNATVAQTVLHDITIPYDILNLTLSQIGLDTVDIPTFTIS